MKVHHVMKDDDFEDCNINLTRYADLRYTSLQRLKIAVETNRNIFHDWFVEHLRKESFLIIAKRLHATVGYIHLVRFKKAAL